MVQNNVVRNTAIGLLAVAMVVATACSTGGATATPGPIDAEPVHGGSLTAALQIPFRSFDPAYDATGSSVGDAARLAAVFDYLFLTDPTTGEVKPNIGESLTPSPDGRVWTMKIRPGVAFSDGTPYDAEAVRFTYQHYVDVNVSPEAKNIATWSMTALDPLTLRITVPQPTMHLDKTIAQSLPFVVSPTAMKADPKGFAQEPVGAGPFVLSELVRDDHETYTANLRYWQPGQPYVQQLRMNTIPDASQRINAIVSGQVQLQPPSADSDLSLFEEAQAQALSVYRQAQSGGGWIYFNNRRRPFDDPRAREAIYLSIDRQQLAEIMQGSPDAHAVETLFASGSPFHQPDLTFPTTDRARAQQLFDQLAAEGRPVDFVYVNFNSGDANARTVEYLQSQLRDMRNVSMRIDTIDITAARERVFLRRDFDMSPYPGAYRFPDPEPSLYNLLYSKGAFNTAGYANSEVDAAMTAARATAEAAQRASDYRIAQEHVVRDLPGLATFVPALTTVLSPTVTGIEYNAQGLLHWNRIGLRS